MSDNGPLHLAMSCFVKTLDAMHQVLKDAATDGAVKAVENAAEYLIESDGISPEAEDAYSRWHEAGCP